MTDPLGPVIRQLEAERYRGDWQARDAGAAA